MQKLHLGAALAVLVAGGASHADVNIFGFNHSPVGNATLTSNPDGTLTVGNLGSSGNDGVAVDLTGVPTRFVWEAAFGGTNPLATEGNSIVLKSIGTFNGATNTVASMLTISHSSSGIEAIVDFLEGDPDRPIVVNYMLNGSIVASDTAATKGTQISLSLADPPDNTSTDVDGGGDLAYFTLDTKDNNASLITTINGEHVTADQIELVDPPNGAWTQTGVQLLGAGGVSSFDLAGESLTDLTPEPTAIAILPLLAIAALRRRNRTCASNDAG